jgi:hypothetical protein
LQKIQTYLFLALFWAVAADSRMPSAIHYPDSLAFQSFKNSHLLIHGIDNHGKTTGATGEVRFQFPQMEVHLHWPHRTYGFFASSSGHYLVSPTGNRTMALHHQREYIENTLLQWDDFWMLFYLWPKFHADVPSETTVIHHLVASVSDTYQTAQIYYHNGASLPDSVILAHNHGNRTKKFELFRSQNTPEHLLISITDSDRKAPLLIQIKTEHF